MTHTPGPWRVFSDIIITKDGDHVATIEIESDADIIAAAPELLAALKECLDYIEITMEGEDIQQYPTERSAINHARAAIAKAEGK